MRNPDRVNSTDQSGWRDERAQPPRKSTVLIVEDNDDLRDLLVMLLRLSSFDTEGCGTAEEALAALRTRPFDLVLTDYELPGETGGWMLRQAGAEGLLTSTSAVVITAHPDPEADDFEIVGKPFDPDDLLALVRHHTGQGPPPSDQGEASVA
jgi:DNA-binding NtrC family response regulator